MRFSGVWVFHRHSTAAAASRVPTLPHFGSKRAQSVFLVHDFAIKMINFHFFCFLCPLFGSFEGPGPLYPAYTLYSP